MNKKAFSMIEILISVSIIIILAIVATTTSNNLKNNSNNSKVVSDLNTIENALVSFKMETNSIAIPGGNNNNFDKDGVYSHSFTSTGTFGVYGKFTENTLDKRFLDIAPLDPRTNQYYSYGITKDTNNFELAGVIGETDNFVSKVVGDYQADGGIHSLIREYNGPNFISDKSTNLPYNPNDRILVATDSNGNVYKKGDTINNNTGSDLEIFFSDGSTSLITDGTIVTLSELDFPKENNLVSKVNLFLQAGSIWTKATKLDNESSFDVYTSDMTASVRGTIFKVEIATDSKTEVTVLEGKVEVSKGIINDGEFEVSEVLDTLEVNELPDGTLENTEVIDSVNETPTNYTPIIDSDNMGFSHTLIINTLVTEPIKDTPIIKDIQETYEPKNCYLEGVEIENGKSGYGYLTNKSTTCESPSNKKPRTCTDGKLDTTNSNYKYAGCNAPDKCASVYDGNVLGIVKVGDEKEVQEEINILGGTKELIKTVTCKTDLNLSVLEIELEPVCDSVNGFILSLDKKSCECTTGTSYNSIQRKCVATCVSGIYIDSVCQDSENTLGSPWILYAIANYNTLKSFDLVGKDGIFGVAPSAINHSGHHWNEGVVDSSKSFTKIGSIYGVYIDAPDNDDSINYSGLDLGSNFAIEMKVQNVWKTKTGNKYVFDNNNGNGLMIGNISNGIISQIRYGNEDICSNLDANPNNDCELYLNTYGDFITITVINGDKIKITDGTNTNEYIITSSINNPTYLYVGGKSNKTYQINGVVDYFKIYKK